MNLGSLVFITELNKKLCTLKYMNIKQHLLVMEKKLVLRCHNQRISLNLKKRQRNDEEDGQDQVLSLRELKAYLIKNLRILMKNFL